MEYLDTSFDYREKRDCRLLPKKGGGIADKARHVESYLREVCIPSFKQLRISTQHRGISMQLKDDFRPKKGTLIRLGHARS